MNKANRAVLDNNDTILKTLQEARKTEDAHYVMTAEELDIVISHLAMVSIMGESMK